MALDNLATVCCGEEGSKYFKQFCGENLQVDDQIAAVAIIENASLPKVGDTISISTSMTPIVLTRGNYSVTILQYIRDKQFECEGGGEYWHFLHTGLLKASSRAKPTTTNSDVMSRYIAPVKMGQSTTAELMLAEHYLPNIDVIQGIQKRASSISVIYFFKQGCLVKDADADATVYISDAGFEVTGGESGYVKGTITLTEQSEYDDFYFVANPSNFIKDLKKKTEFTFGTPTVTGATAKACGSKGGCLAYTGTEGTQITIAPDVNELTSCPNWNVYLNCSDELGMLSETITINPNTGLITVASTLGDGTYKLTVEVTNDCGIIGSQCYLIEVQPD